MSLSAEAAVFFFRCAFVCGGSRGAAGRDPRSKDHRTAEELLVRLEIDGVAVRLNLLGQPGEQPDFVVAAWVLPYVYALCGAIATGAATRN